MTTANTISQPDVTLTLDVDAVITDVTVSNTVSGEFVKTWLGRPWIETVADSGVEKVRRSVSDARSRGVSAYRQILQRFPSGLELPIEYTTVRLGDGGLVAVGRNLQVSSELQSRLIAAQQAMEKDYWKLREVETRYRLLFDAANEAVLVLSSDDLRVVEANPAAIRGLGLTRGREFLLEMATHEHESFRAMVARAREGGRAPGGVFHIGAERSPWILRASLMNDDAAPVYMLQLVPVGDDARAVPAASRSLALANLVQSLPDGFIALDRDGVIRGANQAFLDLVQVGAEGGVLGRRFDQWLDRASEDLSTLLSHLRRADQMRLYTTTIRGDLGAITEVEMSAGADSASDPSLIGVLLRGSSRRVPGPGDGAALPALPALDRASGTPLKALVQAAVAVVERHYVESALRITDGNRTAAAGRLGLSRQSLYAKLNRYGLESGSQEVSQPSG